MNGGDCDDRVVYWHRVASARGEAAAAIPIYTQGLTMTATMKNPTRSSCNGESATPSL